jgi:hypothetical protein
MLFIRRVVPWLLVAAALGLFLAPIDPIWVERTYSGRLYLQLQPRVSAISNRLPFAAFDVILLLTVVTAAWVLAAAVRGFRRGERWRAVGRGCARLLALGACLYIWFVGAWGLNYRRVPLLQRLELSPESPTPATVLALGQDAVVRMNRLHDTAHASGWTEPWNDSTMETSYRTTQRALGRTRKAIPAPLKHSIIGPYFRWASVDGMVNPFALEVLANPDLLPFERPFVAAHEWAHLAGYADESEANFVGWLVCMRADAAAQYSASLFLYWEVSSVVPETDRARLAASLEAGPRADVAAVVDRVRRGQLPTLRRASWAAYDQYLKANHVEAGVRSYDLVITLLARAQFNDRWVPRRLRARHDAAGSGTP